MSNEEEGLGICEDGCEGDDCVLETERHGRERGWGQQRGPWEQALYIMILLLALINAIVVFGAWEGVVELREVSPCLIAPLASNV
jgi:hypothetical protein